ncbi:MAG: hypothetical protein JWP48_2735 [Actinoallomurus sp.]|jgi:hypothetical protein|nr:hypothetical protein [Actinoallomurus sp.]
MGIMSSRRPIMPLAIWAMTAALAYAAGRNQWMGRKVGEPTKNKAFKRRDRKAAFARSRA